jgi:hypothetical protein
MVSAETSSSAEMMTAAAAAPRPGERQDCGKKNQEKEYGKNKITGIASHEIPLRLMMDDRSKGMDEIPFKIFKRQVDAATNQFS